MKRLFNTRKKTEEEVGEQGNTLDRIVKDKEGVKKRLEEEEKSFMNKKREYERKMIDFEKQVGCCWWDQTAPHFFILSLIVNSSDVVIARPAHYQASTTNSVVLFLRMN